MYTVDYFIQKFEAIPEEKWMTGDWNKDGRSCANGHCGCNGYVTQTKESMALWRLFKLLPLSLGQSEKRYSISCDDYGRSVAVNDGATNEYTQPTPKQRILAALYDIKKMQQPQYPDLTQSLAVLPIEETSDVVKVKEVVK